MRAHGHKPFFILLLLGLTLVSVAYETAISADRKFEASPQAKRGPVPFLLTVLWPAPSLCNRSTFSLYALVVPVLRVSVCPAWDAPQVNSGKSSVTSNK